MTDKFAEKKQQFEEQIFAAEKQLDQLQLAIDDQDHELDKLYSTNQQYQILSNICSELHQLEELGASALFWGEHANKAERDAKVNEVQDRIASFQREVDKVNDIKSDLGKQVENQLDKLDELYYLLNDVLAEEDRRNEEFVVEREVPDIQYRPMLMPWLADRRDRLRFAKALASAFSFVVLLNLLIFFWELPEITPEQVEVPEYLVEMVKKDKPKPRPPVEKPKPKVKEEPKKEEQKVASDKPKPSPTPEEKKVARKKAETAGVLAFKDSFQDLLADDVDQKLGASANLRNKASSATGTASRNLVMSQATNNSGGISNAKISRGVGGLAGGQMGSGVSFSRVESAIGTDMIADDRPLSDGVGPTRTDEEIQIVFDRYKATLYRIYNRELRNNPFLKGKMVLRITIEPDGSVSFATIESTDMDSKKLVGDVVARVKRFNFGTKDGVPTITILYPIDFLPAA